MLKTIAAVLLAGAVCGNASAQVISDSQFGSSVRSILSQNQLAAKALGQSVAQNKIQRVPVNRLENVLTAMNDLPGTGYMLVQWLRNHPALKVDIDPSLAAAETSVIGASIAQKTAALMLANFATSAEKNYIIASRMAETYFELGGTRAGLADLDKDTASAIQLWISNDPVSGAAYLAAKGDEPLSQRLAAVTKLRQETIDFGQDKPQFDQQTEAYVADLDAIIAKIQASMQEFEGFKSYEKEWMQSFRGMVK